MVMTTTPTSSSTYTRDSNLLFKKVYDGFTPPITNELKGTCHVGQLIDTGVQQETINGEALRQAYVGDDVNLNLFPTEGSHLGSSGSIDGKVYFRGDDQQRTLMSGQILVEALFPTTEDNSGDENVLVDWHTGDYDSDPIYPNSNICPRLGELQKEAVNSKDFQAFNNSVEAQELERVMQDDLGGADWMHILDCQMTSICTGRPLPSVLDDFVEDDDDSMFSRIYRHASDQLGKVYEYNDGEYAKLSMAPVLGEILEKVLLPSLSATSRSELSTLLHITSGHDTTVMPLLSALRIWDTKWAPYASMVVIETYHASDVDGSGVKNYESERALRIVYNGEVITGKLQGCEEGKELCDLKVLVDYLQTFATSNRDCSLSSPPSPSPSGGNESSSPLISTSGWLIILFLTTAFTTVVTSFLVSNRIAKEEGRQFKALVNGDEGRGEMRQYADSNDI